MGPSEPRGGYVEMPSQHIQEELGYAYVHAVSAAAGCPCYWVGRRDYGVDARLSYLTKVGGKLDELGTYLDMQLKSSVSARILQNEVSYDLEVDDYQRLIQDRDTPRILVLFVMPNSRAEWLCADVAAMSLKHCAYWVDLRGLPNTTNKTKQAVRIDKTQTFDMTAICGALRGIATRRRR